MTSSLTDKQRQLIQTFEGLIQQYNIELLINPTAGNWPSQSTLSIDIEHDESGNMVGIGLSDGRRCAYYTDILPSVEMICDNARFVAHNGISDFECLRQWGIPVRDEQLVHDTYLIGHIQDSSLKAYGLKDMAKRELGIEYPSYDDIVGKHKMKCNRRDCHCDRITLDKQPVELVAMYCACGDAYSTYRLYEKQKAWTA